MVIANKTARGIPSNRQVARQQARIRAGWSKSERRQRALQATEQMELLWSLIQSGGEVSWRK